MKWRSLFLVVFVVVLVVANITGSSVAQRTVEFTEQWAFETRGVTPQSVLVSELNKNVLFATLKEGGLLVLDVNRKPTQIARIGTKQLGEMHVMHLTQKGKYLYLALGDLFGKNHHAGLAVIDVSIPRRPQILDVWKSAAPQKGSAVVLVDDKTAYLGAMANGLMTFDISTPSSIKHLTTYQPDVNWPRKKPSSVQHPNARGMALKGNYLFLCFDAGGLRVIDIRNPAQPREIGRYINQTMFKKQQAYNEIVIDGNRAFVGVDYAGVEVLDIRSPAKIRQVGWWNPWRADRLTNIWFNSPGHTNQLHYNKDRKHLYVSAGDAELQVLDVSNAKSPKLHATFGKPKNKRAAWGLCVSGETVYLTYLKAAFPYQGQWSGLKAVTVF